VIRTAQQIRKAIGRPDLNIPFPGNLAAEKRILVTGAAGHVGQPLVQKLHEIGARVTATDIDTSGMWECVKMDVTDFQNVLEVCRFFEPSLIIHLAASKHAPEGEDNPWAVANINVLGTKNVLDMGYRTVLASTCKAIEPETAYGASKLVAERMTLNQGGSVARFYNVPECGPNVVQHWEAVPKDDPLPVTPCTRFMLTLPEALALIGWAAVLEPGRYVIDAGEPVDMLDFAHRLFPDRNTFDMRPRRGDRLDEPRRGKHEAQIPTRVQHIDRVTSWHD
jgi:FlaA1/EpsC-like NDP-sugar epimerase